MKYKVKIELFDSNTEQNITLDDIESIKIDVDNELSHVIMINGKPIQLNRSRNFFIAIEKENTK